MQRGDTKLTLKDCYEIIDDFDQNGDGNLNMTEFVQAFAAIGTDIMSSEKVNADVYNRRVEKHILRIKELFNKLDADNSGSLDGKEMKKVVELYSGESFDESKFLSWYDSNGGSGDGSFDVKEFGWSVKSPPLRRQPSTRTAHASCLGPACDRSLRAAFCRLIADYAGLDNEEKMTEVMDGFADAIAELKKRNQVSKMYAEKTS